MITRCYFCGGPTSRGLVTAGHWWGGELALFQHVPADVCQECGERYYDAETVGRMDELRQRVRREHRVTLHSASPGSGLTAHNWLNLPEAQPTVIPCPVCDATVSLSEPLRAFIEEFVTEFDGEATRLALRVAHPGDVPESKTLPEHSPILVDRYWRYAPTRVRRSEP